MANFNALSSKEEVHRRLTESPYFRRHGDHFHFARGITRREFLKSAGASAAALMSAAFAPSLTAFAAAASRGAPNPIPGGFELGGTLFHLETPNHPVFGSGPPETEDPSTIGDFLGQVAMGYATGMGEHLDKVTGVTEQMAYEVDLRVMKGQYIDVQGTQRSGNFVLIWLDVFDGSGTQIHDFNPGISPSGVFWTTTIRSDQAHINPDTGSANLDVRNLRVPDYFDAETALFPPPGFKPEPGVVSFRGQWPRSRDKHQFDYQDPANPAEKWQGTFVLNSLSSEWTGETRLARYVSGPLSESSSLFAEVGFERNGFFYQ